MAGDSPMLRCEEAPSAGPNENTCDISSHLLYPPVSACPPIFCISQGYQGVLNNTLAALQQSTPPCLVSCLSLRVNASVKVPQIQQSHVALALFAVIAAFKWKIDIIAVLSQHTAVCTFVQCSLRTISIHWHRKVTDAVCK